MKRELILQEIKKQNAHWAEGFSSFGQKKFQRNLFSELINYLPEKQILSIVGLRRTGKTTLSKQIIEYLIREKNIKAQDILFISFDEALITSKLSLNNYLDVYLDEINTNKNLKYIILDEIQYINKWQHILKRYYDTRGNIKFIITGSSSLFIRKKTTESLAGRIYEFKLNHLCFEEFLIMSRIKKSIVDQYSRLAVNILDKVKYSKNDYQSFLTRHGNELEHLFEKYLLYYQFPEIVNKTDKKIISKYITDAIYKKSIEYDIPRLFDVDKIDELKFVFQILINEASNIIEYTNIASETGIELNTLKNYLSYFHESLLFDVIYNYSKSFRKSKRLQKKGYVASTNFFTAFHPELFKNQIIASQYMGKLAENYVYNVLKEKFQYISFYKKVGQEIDFVCNNDFLNKNKSKLIEVKYTNNIKQENFSFLESVAKNIFKTDFYYIFSKNYYSIQKNKAIIPCFLIK